MSGHCIMPNGGYYAIENGSCAAGETYSDDAEAEMTVIKARVLGAINAWRMAANMSTFTHSGKVIACDALSRSDIDGVNGYVALFGAMPPDFPGVWKATDNSYLPIADVTAWKEFYTSMVAQGAANFAHSQALKAQLQAIIAANALPSSDAGYMTDDDARAAIEALIP